MVGTLAETFTITGSSGLCVTCFRPDTWKTGYGAPRSAGHRKAGSFPRFVHYLPYRFDYFVERILIPQYTRGERRQPTRHTKEWLRRSNAPASAATAGKCGNCASGSACCRPYPQDQGYRRLRYARVPMTIARVHRTESRGREDQSAPGPVPARRPQLELSQEKPTTHASTEAANSSATRSPCSTQPEDNQGRRPSTGSVRLRVPRSVIKANAALYQQRGNPRPGPAGEQQRPRHRAAPTVLNNGVSRTTRCATRRTAPIGCAPVSGPEWKCLSVDLMAYLHRQE